MTQDKINFFPGLFRHAGVGWYFNDAGSDAERAGTTRALQDKLREAEDLLAREYRPRERVDLEQELGARGEELVPFVQALATPMTPRMLAMVYLACSGAKITGVDFHFETGRSVTLRVKLETDGNELVFDSEELWDMEILRHFGTLKINDAPAIDGYYALRLGD